MKQLSWSLVVLAFGLALVLTSPAIGRAESESVFPFSYSAPVAQMLSSVQSSEVYSYTGYLSGQFSVSVGGQPVLLTSRNLYNSHLTQATQYVYEFMQARGIAVSYDDWHDSVRNVSGRNVVGVITGTVQPDEIVLVTAHLDDMPATGAAPGADDDASGSVGVMMAAARLAGHPFARTIRFVFFTGEEYGEFGSHAYAQGCLTRNEKLVAVYNMDMIGWDGNNDGDLYLA